MIANTITHYALYGKFKRERLLARPGRLLVRKGQEVSSQDPVAEANLTPEYLELEVTKWLNIPEDELDAFTERREGDTVNENDILAVGPAGLVQPTVRTPCAGRVLRITEGKIIIEKSEIANKLLAVYPGEVVELIPDRGVVIETTGALVQGVWGNEKISSGRLHLSVEKKDDSFNVSSLRSEHAGRMLVGGYCSQLEALHKAVDIRVKGLVLSSMEARLVKEAIALPIPIVLMEGFGKMPYNETVFELLTHLADRESILNAQALKRAEGLIPELIAPISKDFGEIPFEWLLNESTPNETAFMVAGGKVRIVNTDASENRIGHLVSILPQPQILTNGLRCMVAEVKLNNEELIVVPLANLELLE